MIRTAYCLQGCGVVGWHEQDCPGERIEQLTLDLAAAREDFEYLEESVKECEHENRSLAEERDEKDQDWQAAERTLDKIQKLASDVADLQEPDPDTGDRNVSFLALMEVLEG